MGAKEVAAGAAWLDENFPGWEREIDLGTLNLADCQECVCGQALRDFAEDKGFVSGFDAVLNDYPDYQWVKAHGFFPGGGYENWKAEERLWVELLKERFSTGNLSDNGVS